MESKNELKEIDIKNSYFDDIMRAIGIYCIVKWKIIDLYMKNQMKHTTIF